MKISTNNYYINFQAQKKNQPVYALDAHKNLQKFDTRKEASITLGVSSSAISGVLLGQCNRAGIYTFLSPEEIEKIDAQGNVKIDDGKVEAAKSKIITAIYAIDKDKNYIRFSTQKEASLALGVATGNISRCVHSDAGKCKGYIFVPAQELESIDENGNVVVNIAKIEKLSKSLTEQDAIYVIDENGFFTRYDSVEEASDETGIDSSNLTKGFNGFKKVIGKNTYVKAKNLETKNINGEQVLDEEKMISLFVGNRFSLFVVDKKGKVQFFETQTEASRKLGISSCSITSCLKGIIKNIDGYTFARPNEVLGITKQNQIALDKGKIRVLFADRFSK